MSERYSHRNGETELPTVEGEYWFRGKLNHWLNGELDYAHDGLAGIETVMADYYHPGHEHWLIPGEEGDHLLSDAEGQWWGPIVAPRDSVPAAPVHVEESEAAV